METHNLDVEEHEGELRSALVCEENAESKIAIGSALEKLRYVVEFAESTDDAFDKLRFKDYALLVLNERFDGGGLENNAIYTLFQFMPMSRRRNIFLALIGGDFKTGDNMTAFEKSVNLVVNEKDIHNVKTILKTSVADNDNFYKVFKKNLAKKS